jgi:hypothetical protein
MAVSERERDALIAACKAGVPTVVGPPPGLQFRAAGNWPPSDKSCTEPQTAPPVHPDDCREESQGRSACRVLPVIECRTEREFWDLVGVRPLPDSNRVVDVAPTLKSPNPNPSPAPVTSGERLVRGIGSMRRHIIFRDLMSTKKLHNSATLCVYPRVTRTGQSAI